MRRWYGCGELNHEHIMKQEEARMLELIKAAHKAAQDSTPNSLNAKIHNNSNNNNNNKKEKIR